MQNSPQTASVVLNIEGAPTPMQFTRTVPACSSVVVGVHALPGIPSSANFRTQVGWPGLGSATLIMRPLGADFANMVVMPPVAVLR